MGGVSVDFGTINSSTAANKRNLYLKNVTKSKENPIFLRRTSSALTSKYGRRFHNK